MDKLKLHTPDLTAANIEKLAALFPGCVTEARDEKGALTRAIDFDQLRQELSGNVVEGPRERYHLDWPGKREALLAANTPIAKTLRPCREESVNFDTTKNLFIEGDNLDALKLLQETYLGKVKMIYIDPPYNTGNDFIYEDDFAEDSEGFLRRSNQKDEAGNRLVQNTDANGRFHSDWLSMMYPRLKLARNLLSDDGVMFISIGDGEVASMRLLCDNVFGADNFIAIISRVMKSGGSKGKFFSPNIDFIVSYARDINVTEVFRDDISEEQIRTYYNKKQIGGDRAGEIYGEERIYVAGLDVRPNQRYWIKCPDGSYAIPPGNNFPETVAEGEKIKPASSDGVWKWTYSTYKEELDKGNIVFKETTTSALVDEKRRPSKYNLYNKIWLEEQKEKGRVPLNLISNIENRQSSAELKVLDIPFDFAKPSGLIAYLAKIARTRKADIIIDLFAGSSTTAHAVMGLNAGDCGGRRFVMVQCREICDPTSEAFKAGYQNIAELSKERIRRAGTKIKTENATTAPKLDIGFRVLKIDTSNMADVYYAPDAVKQTDLVAHTDNIKPDRTPEDLLFQVLVDWGVDLSLPIAQETVAGKKVFFVDGNALAACFEPKVSEDLVKELAKRKPLRAVFRDSSYDSDSMKINVEQIFKLLSPETEVKSL
jgi:adenine-specific DNA-methyltransferase